MYINLASGGSDSPRQRSTEIDLRHRGWRLKCCAAVRACRALRALCLCALLISLTSFRGQAQNNGAQALAGASLEDLMKIDVTSVSKKEQALSKTGAAVFVIGQEDIRRSGASNIPDLLRMVPGVEVAQVSANQWAISIRGFNALFSNKVLVLIDGRTVYSHSFSGVFWDQVDTPLEDIERIEVIRGPGGTVWGANAVNGVINIITKSAADTKGGTLVAGSGSKDTARGTAQYGGDAGSQGAYRVFGKYFNLDNSVLPGGLSAADGWHTWHIGARGDWAFTSGDNLSLQGDFIRGLGGTTSNVVTGYPPQVTPETLRISDQSVDAMARWEHVLKNGSETSLQVYESDIKRVDDGDHVAENTIDVEFGHHLRFRGRQDVVWGLDYRLTREDITPVSSFGIQIQPAQRSDNLFAAFAQDEIRIAPDAFLTVGTKLEHNAYTGFELEPSGQFVWNPSPRRTLWASAARAIREPDSLEHGMTFELGVEPVPGAGNALLLLSGNPHLEAERLTDFEAGYRTQLNSRFSIDVTGYLSYYRHLLTTETRAPYVSTSGYGASAGQPLLVVPLVYGNMAHASDYGAEAFANWQVNSRWRISPGISLLRMSIADYPGGNDASIIQTAGNSPRQQAELRSQLNLPGNLEWDSSVKYVDALSAEGVPAYTRVDVRLGWHTAEQTEFSLSGQNLLGGKHLEFVEISGLRSPTEISRTISAKITLRF